MNTKDPFAHLLVSPGNNTYRVRDCVNRDQPVMHFSSPLSYSDGYSEDYVFPANQRKAFAMYYNKYLNPPSKNDTSTLVRVRNRLGVRYDFDKNEFIVSNDYGTTANSDEDSSSTDDSKDMYRY